MNPSKYQQAIFDFVKTGQGNAIIQAGAGSGKSTTIVESAKLVPSDKRSIFVAFNKAIADELKTRLPAHIRASTLHSYGLSLFTTGPEIQGDKLSMIVDDKLKAMGFTKENNKMMYWQYSKFLRKIIPLIKAELANYSSVEEIDLLAQQYNVNDAEIDEFSMKLLKDVMKASIENTEVIDFDDMIYMPIIYNFKAKTYDFVFVDELQDLNKSQFELIKKMCDSDTRIIGVGDRRQSIYAFRGADTASMDNFKEYFHAIELPLSICYRCPKKHIDFVHDLAPELEARDGVIEGVLEYIGIADAMDRADSKTLILSRTNAPLVKVALKFILAGKKAIIRGRDIGANLINMVNRYKVTTIIELQQRIKSYRQTQCSKLVEISNGDREPAKKSAVITLIDVCDTLLAFIEESDSIAQLKQTIMDIFSDNKDGIVCSSIHKAKGLEADKVMIVNFYKMPHPMASSEEEIQQEYNIKYVALTRSKSELYIIEDEI